MAIVYTCATSDSLPELSAMLQGDNIVLFTRTMDDVNACTAIVSFPESSMNDVYLNTTLVGVISDLIMVSF